YHTGMIRLAQAFVADQATAEDVAQEAWLGVLRGLPAFEGRSSLRTWIYRILINDMAVNPVSKKAYLSVSRGRGPDAAAVIPERRFRR
ncbi:MAG: RNA polymerase sigma factor, partial [Sphingopyxis sp.]|nr:RNA polymerase sigma factor [Sphingopyxis sp.]